MDTTTAISAAKSAIGIKLLVASGRGEIDKVRDLLSQFKSPDILNAKNSHGSTPLMLAAKHGHIDVVNLLIDAQADVNRQDNWGYTALIYAVLNNRVLVVQALLTACADVNVVDSLGFTALQLAERKKDNAAMIPLLSPASVVALQSSAANSSSQPALGCLAPRAPTVVFSSTLQVPPSLSPTSLSPQSKDNLIRHAGHTPKRPSLKG